jgi:hypothetical protein
LELGIVAEANSSEHFAADVNAETAKWKRAIEQGKTNKIKAVD